MNKHGFRVFDADGHVLESDDELVEHFEGDGPRLVEVHFERLDLDERRIGEDVLVASALVDGINEARVVPAPGGAGFLWGEISQAKNEVYFARLATGE